MRPPACATCGTEADTSAEVRLELVRFDDYQPLRAGTTGHPPGLEWFCREHLEAAQALQGLPAHEAIAQLRSARRA